MLNLIIYFISIAIVTFILVIVISFVRAKLGSKIFRPLVIQPYSGNSIKKNYFLGLAFLESPLILTAITAFSFFDLTKIAVIDFKFIPFLYILFSGISASISIYFTGIAMYYFFKTFGAHPQYDTTLLMQLLIFCSTLQAPFIIFIVSLFIHKNFLVSHLNIFDSKTIYFVLIHLLILIFVQFAVMKNIKNIIKEISYLYIWFPKNIKQIFVLVIMQIGFLQAPYIFSFITFLLLLQVYVKIFIYKIMIFSFLAAVFAIIGFFITNESGKIASKSISYAGHDIKHNNSIFNLSILAQILLDSRILYILIILLIHLSYIA